MQVENTVLTNNIVSDLSNNPNNNTSDDISNEIIHEPPLKKGPGQTLSNNGHISSSHSGLPHVVPNNVPNDATALPNKNLVVSTDRKENSCSKNNYNNNSNNTRWNVSAASLIANKYLILDQQEASNLHMCININTQQQFVCKVVNHEWLSSPFLSAHHRLDCQPHINSPHEVLIGDKYMYLVFPPSYGDLHSYVRHCKRLREPEARRFFRQMAETVRACHHAGIVLRDLKLRKFVFADPHRSELKLETLEDAVVLVDTGNDCLQDKRGCPAYVSPEILRSHARYSGKAADIWSLGVILYTMLVGRYPFNDTEHASLFAKISRGYFLIPDCLSSRAKCLIRSLLRRNPSERLTADDVLLHPWLTKEDDRFRSNSNSYSSSNASNNNTSSSQHYQSDQTVPQL